MGLATFAEKIIVKRLIIFREGGGDNGVVGLVSLDDGSSGVEVATSDATENLGKEMEGALFGGVIWERKAGIGLDNANGGEVWEVETFGDGLSTDDDVDIAVFDGIVKLVERFGLLVVGIKTSDGGFWEEAFEFIFEKLGAKAFVNDAVVVTIWAVARNGGLVAASVTEKLKIVNVESIG